ncbi:SOS response-associated peptidase [Shewanella sp. Scap07]|uniref:SOS response-associated peptidase n=1 Tax=Shewanella sp. Scap07 TaxID=2589987 RepID=UPI0015BB83AC|nr:SOS response-associated peptidase family protein [Shewanella sp. Scap07]QLE86911.1 SOS response-associated peptidase [Shewanella sp. Scap07]
MCGRLNIIADPLIHIVSDALGLTFNTQTSLDLRPSEGIAAIAAKAQQLTQVNAHWGIQPQWSKKLIINAQVETAATKRTFAQAYHHQRVVIPCSGWYEWSSAPTGTKQKYLFSHKQAKPLFMAGLQLIDDDGQPKFVTLTTSPNPWCADYHHRMPLLIPSYHCQQWLRAESQIDNVDFTATMQDWLTVKAA